MPIFDLVDDRVVFLAARFVDAIVRVLPRHRPIRRDHVHVELVDVVKLGGFSVGSASHAGEFVVEPEIILDRDGGERLGLAIDLDPFLRFDRLMQSVAPTAAGHFAAGVFVDDDDLIVLDDVLDVFFEETIGAEELRDVVDPLRLAVAMILPFDFRLLFVFRRKIRIEIDLGEFADQIR